MTDQKLSLTSHRPNHGNSSLPPDQRPGVFETLESLQATGVVPAVVFLETRRRLVLSSIPALYYVHVCVRNSQLSAKVDSHPPPACMRSPPHSAYMRIESPLNGSS